MKVRVFSWKSQVSAASLILALSGGLTVGTALSVLGPQSQASTLVLLTEEAEQLARKLLQTETGVQLVRTVLGNRAARMTPAMESEFFNTLMQPGNDRLASYFADRVGEVERNLQMFRSGSTYRQASVEARLLLEQDYLTREASRLLALSEASTSGRIRFVSGSEFQYRSSHEIYRQEFLVAGESRKLYRTVIADGDHLPLPPSGSGVRRNAFDQLLRWEEQANLRYFRETTQPIRVEVSAVPAHAVDVQLADSLPLQVRDLFVRGDGTVMWPHHPYNSAASPFSTAARVEVWPGRFTASRSVVVQDPHSGLAFSYKSPTNFPHRTEMQSGKVDLSGDVKFSVYRTQLLDRMDARLGPDSKIILLKEIFAASSKTGGNGFVVRDLTPLQDGFYYFPALSIPYEGRKIAEINGVPFEEFWGNAYAKLLGEAKARMLLRYGLQMETPNCQNMLIQLDRNLKPTGKLVFRDISDSDLVQPVAHGLGLDEALESDRLLGFAPKNNLKPNTSNSFWRLDEAGDRSVSRTTLEQWAQVHDSAYVREVLVLLARYEPSVFRVQTIGELDHFLKSPAGQRALSRFHARQN